MLPPVSPNVFSKIGGGSTSLPTILSLKPSAPRSFKNTGLNYQIEILARNFSSMIKSRRLKVVTIQGVCSSFHLFCLLEYGFLRVPVP